MKKRLSALLLLFAAGTLAAASFELPGGILSLPSAGIINPAEGTVEITVTPAGDVKDLRNDWSFAFVLPGKENSNAERTVLGIYTPSGNPETEHGCAASCAAPAGRSSTSRIKPPRSVPARRSTSHSRGDRRAPSSA